MKNKFLTQKISLVTLFLLSAGSLFGRTLTVDSNTESDLTSGLVAWYPLDGNASDMSGNGFNTKINGARPSDDRNGKSNGAFFFDGNDYIMTEKKLPIIGNDKRTISLWFKSEKNDHGNYDSRQALVVTGNTRLDGLFEIIFRNDLVTIHSWGPKRNFNSGTVELNDWHLLTVTHDSGTTHKIWGRTSLFIDGILKNSKGNILNTMSNYLCIGSRENAHGKDATKSATGFIDDVRIYDRALSKDEVHALYKLESTNPSDDRDSPPPPPATAPGTPPDPDYKDTIAELKRLLAEKDKKLAHCENEMDAKKKEIGELTSENAKLQGEVKSLNGKVTGLETEVATLKTDNEGLKGQIQNLREDNQNISYELTVINEHLEEAIKVAETPFINGWVYDPVRGWIFTDAEHFPLVYTHNDESWNYYELGSSDPRYFFNYTTQEWVAWDTVPQEVEQTVAANTNL